MSWPTYCQNNQNEKSIGFFDTPPKSYILGSDNQLETGWSLK